MLAWDHAAGPEDEDRWDDDREIDDVDYDYGYEDDDQEYE